MTKKDLKYIFFSIKHYKVIFYLNGFTLSTSKVESNKMNKISTKASITSQKLRNEMPRNKPNKPPIFETKSTISVLAF